MKQNSNINIEYEARAMVNEEQYNNILAHFKDQKGDKKSLVNINTYFDYKDLFLTEHHMVLRTREIDDKEYELTLKIKGQNGDTEVNQKLTLNELLKIKEDVQLPEGRILDILIKAGIDIKRLSLITELKTERLEIYRNDHTLVIDKNYFNGKIDYNVEVESTSKTLAISYLNEYFASFGVEYKNGYISKSRRAIYNL